MRAALLKAFTDWVSKDTPVGPSTYPRIADRTLVPPLSAAMGFPRIPGRPVPDGVLHPLLDYDVGPGFNYRDQSGIASQDPEIKGVLPQLVTSIKTQTVMKSSESSRRCRWRRWGPTRGGM